MIKPVLIGLALITMVGCSTMQSGPQPLPPVKVITETVQLEIYQPPLPQSINMRDVTWHVITDSPCKPATGENKNPKYYTTEKFQTEKYTKDDGSTGTRAVRDADGKRIELTPLTDERGDVIQVCGNLEQKIAEVEKELGGEFVIMAITPKGYENMAFNLQEIKRYINQQKEIILYYREATAVDGNDDKEDWIKKNQEGQEKQTDRAEQDNEEQAHNISKQSQEPADTGFSLGKLIPGIKD